MRSHDSYCQIKHTCHYLKYVWFGSRLNMNHDSSQSNSITCVIGGSLSLQKTMLRCECSRTCMYGLQARRGRRNRSMIHPTTPVSKRGGITTSLAKAAAQFCLMPPRHEIECLRGRHKRGQGIWGNAAKVSSLWALLAMSQPYKIPRRFKEWIWGTNRRNSH